MIIVVACLFGWLFCLFAFFLLTCDSYMYICTYNSNFEYTKTQKIVRFISHFCSPLKLLRCSAYICNNICIYTYRSTYLSHRFAEFGVQIVRGFWSCFGCIVLGLISLQSDAMLLFAFYHKKLWHSNVSRDPSSKGSMMFQQNDFLFQKIVCFSK